MGGVVSKLSGYRRLVLLAALTALVMVPTAAANAGQGPTQVPVPVVQPVSDCYLRCTSPAVVRVTTPRLTVHLPGPAGAVVHAEFVVRSVATGSTVATGVSGNVGAPALASWQVTGGLSNAAAYRWRARTVDEQNRTSPWTAWQYLLVDTVRPQRPEVSSVEYPEGQPGAVLGTPGTFRFSSASLDVAVFVWSLIGGNTTTTPASGLGPRRASVTITPATDLVNVLEVHALDVAGNRSDTRNYQFIVTPPPDLFSHWTLDEAGGTTAADSGPLNRPGTLSGPVAFGPGYVGGSNGAVFTGDGGRIATSGSVVDTTGSFSVMAWVNPSDLTADRTVVSQDAFTLGFSAAANGGTGGWCFTVRTGGSPGDTATACTDGSVAGSPASGQWTHLGATYDAVTGQIAMHVMGGEGCIGESARSAVAPVAPSSGSLLIGQAAAGGGSWQGGIDDVFAHRRLLAEVEICQQALQ
jgi:hypothetical protein